MDRSRCSPPFLGRPATGGRSGAACGDEGCAASAQLLAADDARAPLTVPAPADLLAAARPPTALPRGAPTHSSDGSSSAPDVPGTPS